MDNIQPGWYHDLSNHDYHTSNGTSSTTLKYYLEKAPAKILWDKLNPKERDNDIFLIGEVTHLMFLEPKLVKDQIVISPTWNNRSSKDRAKRDQFIAENKGKLVVTELMYEQCYAMAQSVAAHPKVQELCDNSINESSIYWEHESGELLKVRPDIISRTRNAVGDLKTTADASMNGVMKSIMNYNYHVSAAMYLNGVNQCTPLLEETERQVQGFNTMFHIYVEKEPPYLVAVYDLYDTLELGDALFDLALARLIEAKQNAFPGYDESIRVVELPPWASRINEI